MINTHQIIPKKDFLLTNVHTLKINSIAKYYISVSTTEQLHQAIKFAKNKRLRIIVLGSGSNSVFCGSINAVVIFINIKGRKVVSIEEKHIIVEINAGENWHNFVQWSLKKGYYGLENLSLIPGTVGAAPVQNIGAYGVELSDYFISLQAVDINSEDMREFNLEDCKFGYRDSVFKNKLSGKHIICSVKLKLNKKFNPELSYSCLKNNVFYKQDCTENQKALHLSQAICNIRNKKLPDPNNLCNAGSFFKNPIVSNKINKEIALKYNKIPAYKLHNGWKISAGWLIEISGMKGYRYKNVGVYCNHALVLVRYGETSGIEILDLLNKIISKVKQKFNIILEVEPEIYIGKNLTT